MTRYLILNWKQNKDISAVNDFVKRINYELIGLDLLLVIAPSYPFIYKVHDYLKTNHTDKLNKSVFISTQDISKYDKGAHTELVGASQGNDVVKYSIVGHSEVRAIGEEENDIDAKIGALLKNSIIPILCFSNVTQYTSVQNKHKSKQILYAYEPVEAIGTGNPADPDQITKMYKNIGADKIIYGGSIDDGNIKQYLALPYVAGFLVGSASLDINKVNNMLKKMHTHRVLP